MKKQKAIDLFGGISETASALEITYAAVKLWPDPLPLRIADRVLGAAWRNRVTIPEHFRQAPKS